MKVTAKAHIQRIADGVVRIHEFDWTETAEAWAKNQAESVARGFGVTFTLEDTLHGIRFWWTDGNGSCDCNRRIYFHESAGEEDERVASFDMPCTDDEFFKLDRLVVTTKDDTGLIRVHELETTQSEETGARCVEGTEATMTYEESLKLKQEIEAAADKIRKPVRDLESAQAALQDKELRKYHFFGLSNGDPNYRFEVSVNPVYPNIWTEWLHHSPNYVTHVAYRVLSEIMEMFEGWKAGSIPHLPPSGEWVHAKVWLAGQQIEAAK